MSAKRLVISGRVQGVGFRDWMLNMAGTLGVAGWVRNCSDGTLEALVAGDSAAVEELLRACRRGPRLAQVDSIDEELAEPPDRPGFHLLPTL
jgi:acylphosphatase